MSGIRDLHTRVCDVLGIRYPIVQAGMGIVARAELAAAVSIAGGLGVIGASRMSPEELTQKIRWVRSQTSNPFGVDLLLPEVPGSLLDQPAARAFVDLVEKQLEVVLEERVPVFASGLGDPRRIVPAAHERGMRVIAVVGSTRAARRVAASGADVIVAQGYDGGGHASRIGTLALVPQVVDVVSQPVLAAGGIGDARGLLAALMLGASGVWMGTRFIVTKECAAHERFQRRIIEIDEDSTVVTRAYTGKTMRAIRNKFTDEWQGRDKDILPFPMQRDKYAPLMIEGCLGGNVETGGMPAGQVSGMIKEQLSAGDLVAGIIAEAKRILDVELEKQ